MAKATEKGGAAKPRASRAPRGTGAAAVQDAGASAPVSAGAAETPAQKGPSLDKAPPAQNSLAGVDPEVAAEPSPAASLGMGRFPPDWTQTRALEQVEEPAESPVWGMPDIAEFPATLTLTNHTPARIRVLAVKVYVLPWEQVTVQCESAEQYQVMKRDLSARANSCRWNWDNGLQVKHEQK